MSEFLSDPGVTTELFKAQSIIDEHQTRCEEYGARRDQLVAALAGVLVCHLRGEDERDPSTGPFDLTGCIRHYADMIDCAETVTP